MKNPLLVALFCMASLFAVAQDDITGLGSTFNSSSSDSVVDAKALHGLVRFLNEFRFQAYVQVEWQRADSASAVSYGSQGTNNVGAAQGGVFPNYANNRFLIRRGRFKMSYQHNNKNDLKVMDFAFQFDATERAFTVKDFYGRIIDPWTGWFGIQAGIFLRPFGYETPANPATFESPEFARVNQSIFPNECELGEAIVIESPAKFDKFYLQAIASIVNGDGVGVGFQTGAYESHKDFIGRLKIGRSWELNSARFGFNLSGSYYNGGVLQTDPNVYVAQYSMGQWAYNNIGNPNLVFKKDYKREYYGAHLELKADYPIGITTLRGEYIAGTQPGTQSSSSVPLGGGNGAPAPVDLYLRRFYGGIVNLTQSFKNKVKGHTMMHDITVKYDVYNPQAQVPGKDLNLINGFTTTDMKYTTIGVGYSFIPYTFFKLMVWYDFVMNENTAIPYWTSDYKGNNVLTIRTQFYVDSWWFTNPKARYRDNLMTKNY